MNVSTMAFMPRASSPSLWFFFSLSRFFFFSLLFSLCVLSPQYGPQRWGSHVLWCRFMVLWGTEFLAIGQTPDQQGSGARSHPEAVPHTDHMREREGYPSRRVDVHLDTGLVPGRKSQGARREFAT
jgi:hypothetical protein